MRFHALIGLPCKGQKEAYSALSRGKGWLLAVALLALLTGCSKGENTCLIYYRTSDDNLTASALETVTRKLSSEGDVIQQGLELLLDDPGDTRLTSPFPAGTRLLSWKLENGLLTVDFSEQYSQLSGMDLTLADYCVVLTMTQFEGVEKVQITAAGTAVPGRNKEIMSAGDAILSNGEGDVQTAAVQLSFPLADGSGLGTEYREIRTLESETLEEAVIRALCEGPTSSKMTGDCFPEEPGEISISVEKGVCTLSLNDSWLQVMPQEDWARELTIYSIVNSLTELDEVDQVLVLWNDAPLWGDGPLEANYQLERTDD